MMIKSLIAKMTQRQMTQDQLAKFIRDEKTIQKAAEGSMRKRNELLERVKLLQKTS